VARVAAAKKAALAMRTRDLRREVQNLRTMVQASRITMKKVSLSLMQSEQIIHLLFDMINL
jgi:hypothetical protein